MAQIMAMVMTEAMNMGFLSNQKLSMRVLLVKGREISPL
jgi:hypothetical protein